MEHSLLPSAQMDSSAFDSYTASRCMSGALWPFGSLERLVPPLFSVALILCQLSSVLGSFGLFFPVLYVLLAELVFLALLCIGLAASKHKGRSGRPR